jgi:hypothetical protein
MTEELVLSNAERTPETKPYIKLFKNTRGYNWEIKQISTKPLDNDFIDEIERLNIKMLEKFSNQE